ncbi:MAG: hypothetical protein HN704_10320 [Bacteroidetes bacterium]|jgi:hypothetical protein|nr:hypothetical protein [Bacteroidota bacterium]MBT6687552.1 hypothetical protein [Bacteroidota bacterium]MBT7142783.1 hypothetical protein [Bacteroidota bacterium]MBT7491986.1 hypothetical protein [Bacteroidota bacterium]
MKKIMHIMLLSCLKATELIEKKYHFHLSIIEKLQLKTHKIICKPCNEYDKQSKIIENSITRNQKNKSMNFDIEQLKKQIITKLETLDV